MSPQHRAHPASLDLVESLVDGLRDRGSQEPLAVLAQVVAQAGDGLAVVFLETLQGRARVASWSVGSLEHAGAFQERLQGATVDRDELRPIRAADTHVDVADLPVLLSAGLEGFTLAQSDVVSLAVAPVAYGDEAGVSPRRSGWLWVGGASVVEVEDLRRAVAVACLAQDLIERSDILSGTALIAEAATSARRDEVESAERLIDAIGAGLGHEVREGLRNVMGWSRLAASNDLGEGVRLEMIRKIQRATEQANAAVGDALELIRGVQSERREPVAVDLNGVLRWVTDVCGAQVTTSHASVIAPTLPTVIASATTLRLVLLELVRNALDHGGQFVQIQISAKMDVGSVELRVRDNGPGLDEEARKRAFEPGFSTSFGTGYGLTRVRETIAEQGGRVWFADDDGHGTVAVVSLPQQATVSQHLDA